MGKGKILFVEDDALIARIYTQKLSDAGFEVDVAEDGLKAVARLTEFRPDLVVLDLLMPKLNGADVLKFIRGHPDLKSTRVIVFSNSFLSRLVDQIAALGFEKAVAKSAVTPATLIDLINEILAAPGGASAGKIAEVIGARPVVIPDTAPVSPPPPKTAVSPDTERESSLRPDRRIFERSPALFKDLRQLCREFLEAPDETAQLERLLALNRRLRFLTQSTGLSGYGRTAELCSALEALVFEMLGNADLITDSVRQTTAATIAFLTGRFDGGAIPEEHPRPAAAVLVVDDDEVSNRALVAALTRAKLAATSLTDSLAALAALKQKRFDAVLLDIAMPGLNGLELCDKMRALPLHKRTPVIFVTGYSDFQTRSRSILSGGNDLITKPILPTEVCVKVIMHLMKPAAA